MFPMCHSELACLWLQPHGSELKASELLATKPKWVSRFSLKQTEVTTSQLLPAVAAEGTQEGLLGWGPPISIGGSPSSGKLIAETSQFRLIQCKPSCLFPRVAWGSVFLLVSRFPAHPVTFWWLLLRG